MSHPVASFMRERASDRPAAEAALAFAMARIGRAREVGAGEALRAALTEAGNQARLLGRWEEAVAWSLEAHAMAEAGGDPRKAVAAMIRLATSRQYAGDPAGAEGMLRAALARAKTLPEPPTYEDFALQHLGKLLVEAGAWDEALACLAGALALREARGDEPLAASSRRALAALEALRRRVALTAVPGDGRHHASGHVATVGDPLRPPPGTHGGATFSIPGA